MRRRLSFIMCSGLLVALAPAGPAAADGSCGVPFDKRLQCWSRAIGQGTVHVTLDRTLRFDGDAEGRKGAERTLLGGRARLVVEVPPGVHTGPGGTALLVLADPRARLVAEDAVIDPLSREALKELRDLGACAPKDGKDPCAPLGDGHRLSGGELVGQSLAVDLSRHAYAVSGSPGGATVTSIPTGSASGKEGRNKESERAGHARPDPDATVGPTSVPDPVAEPGWDTATQVLAVLCAVLVLLLGLLLFLIRRSSRAVGTLSRRALAAPGIGAVPAAAVAPRPRTRAPDEATTRLRVTPTPRHGRRVGNVPGPVRAAVVRTELHPQGYVEVDHVLFRAVWAEPGRPPPAPGGLVDVTDARERDSDVLYAFPPTAGRHAKAGRP
ncbi:hypothetical protein ABZX90_16495 [Streptomyces sp. NPDC002935]|uniref:hypothetical protein n=1 Tax=Streptomyces sp. NPDC002935 TaxID=3154545 RepID=UPI0033B8294F